MFFLWLTTWKVFFFNCIPHSMEYLWIGPSKILHSSRFHVHFFRLIRSQQEMTREYRQSFKMHLKKGTLHYVGFINSMNFFSCFSSYATARHHQRYQIERASPPYSALIHRQRYTTLRGSSSCRSLDGQE